MISLRRFFGLFIAVSALFALGCASTATHESTGQVIDDSAITTKVKKAIFDEPSLKVTQISVETYKSVVQLSGFVDSTAQIGTAASVARSVEGKMGADFRTGESFGGARSLAKR